MSGVDETGTQTPSTELGTSDRGDDVQRRFRYQAAYAAMVALDLLDRDSEFEELFCEHHEDILIRKRDNTFVGIQVKTRDPSREPLKANDDQIVRALRRFVEHHIEYPACYSRFVIATNHAFWRERKKDPNNLYHIVQLAQNAGDNDGRKRLSRPLLQYIGLLSKGVNTKSRASVTPDVVVQVLSRVYLEGNLPKFDDIETRLVRNMSVIYTECDAGFDDWLRASKALINKMSEAGSLSHVCPRETYFALLSDPAQAHVDSVIEGKRITRETVQRIIEESISVEVLLRQTNAVPVSDLPRAMKTMELKMAAGRISVSNIRRSKDHKFSTETLFNAWMHKYGTRKANDRYQHLSVIVGNECQEAYDSVYRRDKPFGQNMLREVRERIRTRLADKPESFFECKYEHLLGVTGVLTEQCDVWWSEEFEIPEEVQA